MDDGGRRPSGFDEFGLGDLGLGDLLGSRGKRGLQMAKEAMRILLEHGDDFGFPSGHAKP